MVLKKVYQDAARFFSGIFSLKVPISWIIRLSVWRLCKIYIRSFGKLDGLASMKRTINGENIAEGLEWKFVRMVIFCDLFYILHPWIIRTFGIPHSWTKIKKKLNEKKRQKITIFLKGLKSYTLGKNALPDFLYYVNY